MSSNLKDKKIIFLGSSVTYGAMSDGYSFVEALRDKDGIVILSKEAVSGTTLAYNGSDSYVQRLKTISSELKPDMMICQLSTNDATGKMPLGKISDTNRDIDIEKTAYDTTTITGAIEYIIHYTYQTWNCPVAFYTGAWFDDKNYADMVDRLHQLEKKWGIYIIDMFSDESFNDISKNKYDSYMQDPIHPNKSGYCNWWMPYIETELQKIFEVEFAKQFATRAHAGQVDKEGLPYITHPIKVASLVDGYDEKIVAYLHDTVEDTDVKIEEIKELFGEKIADAVAHMTHTKNKDYYEYINHLSENEIAVKVKMADLTHNMDISRIPNPQERDYERLEKYKKVYKMLSQLGE